MKKKGDSKYFNRLAKYINNTKNIKISEKVGECFYVYCRENYNPNFNYNDIPITEYKQEIIRDGAKPEINYIIDEFFLNRKDINYSLGELYDGRKNEDLYGGYKHYHYEKYGNDKYTGKQIFFCNMRTLFSGYIKKSHRVETVKCNVDDLYKILKNYLFEDEIKDYQDFKNKK